MRKLSKREQIKRQGWMRRYDTLMIWRKPETAGKQDWDTALFYYLQGVTPLEAVEQICQPKPEGIE